MIYDHIVTLPTTLTIQLYHEGPRAYTMRGEGLLSETDYYRTKLLQIGEKRLPNQWMPADLLHIDGTVPHPQPEV